MSYTHNYPSSPERTRGSYERSRVLESPSRYLPSTPSPDCYNDLGSPSQYPPHPHSPLPSPPKHHAHLVVSQDEVNLLKNSTQKQWRSLGTSTNEDLYLPGVTEDVEEIAGLPSRIRLQKLEDKKTHRAYNNWMDKQRISVQAYEYLCHIGEAKEWIEKCIGEDIPSIVKLDEALRDGVILAKLTRVFSPHLVPRIFESSKLQYRHTDNINFFFNFLDEMGMPDVSFFFFFVFWHLILIIV